MLKYGTGNPRSKKTVKHKDPKARIEELKKMYRDASAKDNEGAYLSQSVRATYVSLYISYKCCELFL